MLRYLSCQNLCERYGYTVTFAPGGTENLTIADGGKISSSTKVTAATGAFSSCTSLKSITLPARLFSIGKSAFVNCTALTEVKFEEGSRLDTINDCAFWGTGLTSIVLPSSLTTLSTGTSTNETVSVFRDCTKLISVTLSANMTSLNRLSFFGCTSLREILVDKGSTAFKSIGGVLFSADGKELVYYPTANTSTEYKVPEGVEKIGDYSFFHYYKSTIVDYADKLIKIILPESVKEIGAYAFRYCANLENIEFAADGQLETIGDYAFANITALKSISVPDSVKTIGNNTFQNDKNLKEVVFDADGLLTEIGNSAFQSTGIESLELPKGVTTIGTSAFSSCASLTNVKLSENLTEISATLFSKCSLLSSITIPKGVTIIGKNAFQSCTKLEARVGRRYACGEQFLLFVCLSRSIRRYFDYREK